jgi:transketolase
LTAEEHQKYGGMGSAIAELLSENFPVRMAMIGINDRFGESGQPEELMHKYGLTAENIKRQVKKLLK